MIFFLSEIERQASGSTYYFEFQNGKHRGKHWRKDSVCLHAEKFDELDLWNLFSNSIQNFAYCGLTEVDREQWNRLVERSMCNDTWSAVIAELTPWVERCFQTYRCFTICGI